MTDHDLRRALEREAGRSTATLAAELGVSQPTLSRALRRLGPEVVVARSGREVRYALARPVRDLPLELPIYEVTSSVRRIATLRPVAPRGYHVSAEAPDADSGWFEDLPWWMHDLRPQGYLGRLVPARHPDLGHPADIRLWSSDQVLRYLALHAADAPGAVVVGDRALSAFYQLIDAPATTSADRPQVWPALAADALRQPAGSSAAGEHPKFLARREGPSGPTAVLVKFSPPRTDRIAARIADLLVAEHLAHGVLRAAGVPAAHSQILEADGRIFLEVERFDRVGPGRRGVASLEAVDAAHVGRLVSWADSADALVPWIGEEGRARIRWLGLFGRWIGNTDMHMGNMSFFLSGTRLDGVAPAYDMQPSGWAPRAGELPEVRFDPALPEPADGRLASAVLDAAEDFWARVASDGRITADFRGIAARCRASLAGVRPRLRWVPGTPESGSACR